MSDEQPDPHPLSGSLDELARRWKLGTVESVALVWSRFAEVVGPALAVHARPLSLRDGVLQVGVDGGAWATELRYLGAEIAARLNALAGPGTVARVEVKVRPETP